MGKNLLSLFLSLVDSGRKSIKSCKDYINVKKEIAELEESLMPIPESYSGNLGNLITKANSSISKRIEGLGWLVNNRYGPQCREDKRIIKKYGWRFFKKIKVS